MKKQNPNVTKILTELEEGYNIWKKNSRPVNKEKSAWIDGAVCALAIIDRSYALSNAALEMLEMLSNDVQWTPEEILKREG